MRSGCSSCARRSASPASAASPTTCRMVVARQQRGETAAEQRVVVDDQDANRRGERGPIRISVQRAPRRAGTRHRRAAPVAGNGSVSTTDVPASGGQHVERGPSVGPGIANAVSVPIRGGRRTVPSSRTSKRHCGCCWMSIQRHAPAVLRAGASDTIGADGLRFGIRTSSALLLRRRQAGLVSLRRFHRWRYDCGLCGTVNP